MSGDRLDAGLDTARITAAEQDRLAREQRQAAALLNLKRRGGMDDITEMLGLTPYTCLNCGLPMENGDTGWFCRRKDSMCNSPRVRRQALAKLANRAKES